VTPLLQKTRRLSAVSFNRFAGTAIEYGLIAGLIAVMIIGSLTTLGSHIKTKFNAIANNLS
jgi:pilus assembly protein Flp/PilA